MRFSERFSLYMVHFSVVFTTHDAFKSVFTVRPIQVQGVEEVVRGDLAPPGDLTSTGSTRSETAAGACTFTASQTRLSGVGEATGGNELGGNSASPQPSSYYAT